MMVYDLQCKNGHIFEGWFDSSAVFEEQLGKGLIACPICDETSISRRLTNFAIKKSVRQNTVSPAEAQPPSLTDEQMALAHMSRKLYDYVEKNFDDVGCDFAKEALKIHYGVCEPRNIRGVSTQAEEKLLKEEGIDVLKLPVPAEKTNSDA